MRGGLYGRNSLYVEKMMSSIDWTKVGVLKDEIEVLRARAQKYNGMGHVLTAIRVLEHRIKELENQL